MAEPERIVTNTGPLIALAGVRRLDILNGLYDEAIVQVVYEKLEKPKAKDAAL